MTYLREGLPAIVEEVEVVVVGALTGDVGLNVTVEPPGSVITLAVEMPVGKVTTPDVSEMMVCPRVLVVVMIPVVSG